jgi:DNA-binding response OmpR family regulator
MSKILLVIGNRTTARFLQEALKSEGHAVATETSKEAGLARARAEDFDLVILALPWKGNAKHPVAPTPTAGFRVIQQLRKSRVRVIAITTLFDEDTRDQATRLGAYECIEQPTDLEGMEHLLATVRMAHWNHPQNYFPGGGITQKNQETEALLLDEMARLRSERTLFLLAVALFCLGSVAVGLFCCVLSSYFRWQLALPIALLILGAGRAARHFLALARDNAAELERLRTRVLKHSGKFGQDAEQAPAEADGDKIAH